MTNSSGAVTDTREYDAFGNAWAPGTSGGNPTPYGFAGPRHRYETDHAAGLMYVGHRYYDSTAGRFISRDPVQDGYNWYAYCGNDPVNYIDPQGLASDHLDPIFTGPPSPRPYRGPLAKFLDEQEEKSAAERLNETNPPEDPKKPDGSDKKDKEGVGGSGKVDYEKGKVKYEVKLWIFTPVELP
jgi:RHS repeat-associated protein